MGNVLITGASGLIGTALTKLLLKEGYNVTHLSRKKGNASNPRIPVFQWNVQRDFIEKGALRDIHHIIHLAGAGIFDKRWTKTRKKEIVRSRCDSLELLYKAAKEEAPELRSLVSASGINYYGSSATERIFTEEDPPGTDFLAEVTRKWEASADRFSAMTRVVKLRTGAVLSGKGGSFPQIAAPIENYIGAPLGRGDQPFPWIHLEDICRAYLQAIASESMEGPYNAVAPEQVTNKEMTRELGFLLDRPVWPIHVPAFLIKLVLGQRAVIALEGVRASCERLKGTGFVFKFPRIREALNKAIEEKETLKRQGR